MNDLKHLLTHQRIIPLLVFTIGLAAGVGLITSRIQTMPQGNKLVPEALVGPTFLYTFNDDGVLEEAGTSKESSSAYWWLNSGGQLVIKGNTGATLSGSISPESAWKAAYAADNPVDTDAGAHPQNIFRLVTRSLWGSARQEAQFLITADNLSASPNRNASNGLLLMSRYQDQGQTLYYAGIRVDGTAVIKKKYKGTYFTMAQKPAFPGTYKDPRDEKSLLPHREWISLRSETASSAGSTKVSLYMKRASEPQWQLLLEAEDSGQYDSTPPIVSAGYAGIRTDFMDVRFENYRLEKI